MNLIKQTGWANQWWFGAMNLGLALPLFAGLEIQELGKDYLFDEGKSRPGLFHHVEAEDVIGGNTSVRNEGRESLAWKGKPDSNGYGYFQRNRDLGQVINVPAEGGDVTLDAIVLRSSRGDNAVMAGTPGAEMYLQLFEVEISAGEILRINENGTSKDEPASHGFDHQFNRADDFIEGPDYRPIHRVAGGIFPQSPTTDRYVYDRGKREQFGEQLGHLRYFRFDLTEEDEITLKAGRRYAFMVGFEEPGRARGLALAISTAVHIKEAAEFVRDENGEMRWGVRREGNGGIVPRMIPSESPPSYSMDRERLEDESLFPSRHWNIIRPTSNGYPDVDTYRTLQFYIEVK